MNTNWLICCVQKLRLCGQPTSIFTFVQSIQCQSTIYLQESIFMDLIKEIVLFHFLPNGIVTGWVYTMFSVKLVTCWFDGLLSSCLMSLWTCRTLSAQLSELVLSLRTGSWSFTISLISIICLLDDPKSGKNYWINGSYGTGTWKLWFGLWNA